MEYKFNHKQLRSARIARGMSMKDLAEKIGVSRQMVSYYESGKKSPSTATLLEIMAVLKFPREFFSAEIDTPVGGATFFRKQSANTKKTREMQQERLKYFNEIYEKLARFVNFPVVNLPELIEKDVHDITEEDIIQKAMELREVWSVDKVSPIKNLVQLAEKNGIVIAESTVSDQTLDALSRWIADRPFIMLADNQESSVRRRFNVAHEIGHIILHNSVESIYDYSNIELKNIIEKQANLFASHFLLPNNSFVDSLLSTSLEYFVELKKYWRVSIQAMLHKAHHLELINDDRYLYLVKQVAFKKWKTKEPLDDELAVEKPTLLEKVYEMVIQNGIASRQELNKQFNLPIEEIKKMISPLVVIDENEKEPTPTLKLIK